MADITYNWVVGALQRDPTVEGKPDYVAMAYWKCYGTDGEFTGEFLRRTEFKVDAAAENFIPYDQLTEDLVIGWIKADLGEVGVNAVQKHINDSIAMQLMNSKTVSTTMPWSAK